MSKSIRGRRAGIASVATSALLISGLTAFAGAASASEPVDFERIKGDDRYGTSVAAAKAFGTSEEVILASGENGHYVDALSSNFLAGVVETPILLTKENQLPPVVKQQLEDGNYSTVHIIGGDGAVSEAVADEVRDTGATVNRIAGSNRYRTNVEVIEAGDEENADTALIATGVNFPDALGAGPVAYAGKHPIGLTKTDDIPDFVVDALKSTGVNKAIIVGGEAAVSDEVESELEAKGIDVVTRLSGGEGGNRETTSIAVRDFAIENMGFSESEVDFASGRAESEGVDALSGGPVSGKDDVAILITSSETRANRLIEYLEENCQDIDEGDIYGGNAAVTVALEEALEDAAQCEAPASATTRPELVRAQIVDTTDSNEVTPTREIGTTVRFDFDEALSTSSAAAPRLANFQVYNSNGTLADAAAESATVSGSSVTVRFAEINTDALAATLTLATVDFNAVTDQQGTVNPIGDAAIGTTGGGSTALPAGVTTAPDLVSVGTFRQASEAGRTAVNFTFDEAAYVVNPTGFSLITVNGVDADCTGPASNSTAPSGGTNVGGNGTTTITVVCVNPDGPDEGNDAGGEFDPPLSATNVARGTVDTSTVSDVQQTGDNSTIEGNDNPLQAADVASSGNTSEPDLVSVQLRPGTGDAVDQALFTFDEPVGTADATDFRLYKTDGSEVPGTALSAQVNASNRTQVLVNFSNTAADNAVGGNVVDGAVSGYNTTTSTPTTVFNEQDEAGVSNSSATPTQTPGRTAAPDLTGVALSRGTDGFGNPTDYRATYTFDEDVDVVEQGEFQLVLADGTILTATACAKGSTEETDNTVTCTAYGSATSAQVGSAVLGTVDDGAVNEEGGSPATLDNPEGAEVTTGGTGTPAA